MNAKKWRILTGIGALLLAIIVVGGLLWYNNVRSFISTDDAYVDGQQIVIAAPTSGKIVDWKGAIGTTFSEGSTVGAIQQTTGDSTSSMAIPVPTDSTIVERTVVNNEFVGMGTPLAYAYNLNDLWVTGNVKETQIRFVNVGAKVDISLDAYPGVTLHGTIARISYTTASTFTVLPSSSNNANFTKVTQVIPVKILLNGYSGITLTPGMDVTIRIHK